MLSRWRIRLWALLRGRRVDAEFDEELRYHLEQQIEQNLASGMDAKEARAAALRQFGNPLLLRDQARETWRWRRLDEIAHDLRYAVRGLRINPGFSAVAILSLGLGIGASTTLFSVIDAVDFRPLPYFEPDRLVWLAQLMPDYADDPDAGTLDRLGFCARCPWLTSAAVAKEWRRRTGSFEALALQDETSGCLETNGVIECFSLGRVSAGFFTLLGVQPALGRDFQPQDTAPGAEPVVIVSHETWLEQYGGDPAVIGSRFAYAPSATSEQLHAGTIIGVLPQSFHFGSDYPAWVPLPDDQEHVYRLAGTLIGAVTVVARLKPGITPAAADAELRAVHAAVATAYPEAEGTDAAIRPLRERIGRNAGKGRGTLFSITLIVLGIAVLNVAGLLISRTAARHRELSVRRALGASRARLIRQFLAEGAVLGLAGGVLGSILCAWDVRIANLHFNTARYGLAAQVDHRVLAFATAVALVAGILATVIPAAGAGRGGPLGRLRESVAATPPRHYASGERSGAWTHGALLVGQIAAALVLLAAAGLLGSDYLMLRYLDLGYDPVNLYETVIRGPEEYAAQPELMRPVGERIRARVEQIPGVLDATLMHYSAVHPEVVRVEGVETVAEENSVVEHVEVDYFDTMGIPILQGRSFSQQDQKGAPPVAIVNRTVAAAYGRGESALGRGVFVGSNNTDGEWLTVVGVVEDFERGNMSQRHYPRIYRPLAQSPLYSPYFYLRFRAAEDRADVARAVETALAQAAAGPPNRPMVSFEEELGPRFVSQRVNAVALNAFAAFALLLAAIGVYGSVAYAVARRTREIGIRMALGAERATILRLFARRAALITALGAVIGLGGSLVLTRVLRSFVSATSVTDPRIFLGAVCMLVAATLLATWLPARRATAVDPTVALRSE